MNYILSLISPVPMGGAPAKPPPTLSEAVTEASRLGILEVDPTHDLHGVEMAQKLLVLGEWQGG